MKPANKRPERIRIADFAGRLFTLDPEAWECLNPGSAAAQCLVLGPPFFTPPNAEAIFCHDLPSTAAAIGAGRPADWQEIDAAQITALAPKCRVYFYKPNLRIAPQFWQPILGKLQKLLANWGAPSRSLAWLPGNTSQLLHQELATALANLGFAQISVYAEPNPKELYRAWEGKLPTLAISVNFRGLDERVFALCREADIPLAVWLVDNPWNLLSAIGLPWWKEAHMFVTDPSYLQPLREYGAQRVKFLPLAASASMFRPPVNPNAGPLFAGRSAFPNKAGFFAGVRLPPGLLQDAKDMLTQKKADARWNLPDFHWWQKKLRLPLWPGKQERSPALGADTCSALRRAAWLAEGAAAKLEIIGDAGWQRLLPGITIRPPVDYYGSLPSLYGQALCSLNITSLLLPQSLSQRHFDVWAAGSFLLSDNTPGLAIFPQELVRPMRLLSAAEFAEKTAWLRHNPQQRLALITEWQELLKREHTYEARLKEICASLGADLPLA